MIVTVINQKGGVGKTTNTIHLGAYLAVNGYKVLLIDFDPQCDLTHGIGVAEDEIEFDIENLLKGNKEVEFLNIEEDLFLLPGNKNYSASRYGRKALKHKLKDIKKYFDFILIDSPPSTINAFDVVHGELALRASDFFIVPIEADEYPIKNLNAFLGAVYEFIHNDNNKPNLLGVFFSNVLVTKNDYKHYRGILEETGLNDLLFESFVRSDAKVQKAVRNGETIFSYKPNCRAAKDFEALGAEFLKKIKSYGKERKKD